jgi:hypothetical protein
MPGQKRIETIAIVGLSKNAGKTTVLNALVRRFSGRLHLGLMSIGVDGEERDAWSGREKPVIPVLEGMLVASASMALDVNPGHWEILESCGIDSTMGEVFLARAKQETRVKLAGIPTREKALKATRLLKEAGADLVLLDGAYDRKSASSPLVSDAVVGVVGASLSPNLPEVVKKTAEWVHLFTLDSCPGELRGICEWALEQKRVVGVGQDRVQLLPLSTLLQWREKKAELAQRKWETLILPGALTDRMLAMLMEENRSVRLIVPDATHCLLSLGTLRRFYQRGGALYVFRKMRLLGVAINPVSPEGYAFSPVVMKERIAAVVHQLPIVDVVRDSSGEEGWFHVL